MACKKCINDSDKCMDLAFATISQLRDKLDKKEISSKELAEYFLDRFKKYDPEIESALEVFQLDSVLKKHKYADENKNKDKKIESRLNGIPGAIKDNICQEGRIATCASKILENFKSTYDATVIERLKSAGATILARVNCDEFAMGSSTENSAYKKTKNPWDLSRVPGGSSGGSAAAVAAGLVPWSLGSDTGGSVRQPAAYCGLVGIKPTYGLVSRYGLIAYASSFDQIGVLTRTVYDNALVFSEIAGQDQKDSTTLSVPKKDYTQGLEGRLKSGLKIGIIEEALKAQGLDIQVSCAVDDAIKVFEGLGATVKRVSMKTLDYSAAAYMVISRAEAASNLARFDGARYGFRAKQVDDLESMYFNTRHDGFGSEVRSRIMVGNYVLSAGYADKFYDNAKKVQGAIRADFKKLFGDIDLLIMPTHSAPAFKVGAFDLDKMQMELQDFFTVPINLAGVPAMSVPCGFTKDTGLPIGFQLIGPHLSEELIFQTAYAYEQATGWHERRPAGF